MAPDVARILRHPPGQVLVVPLHCLPLLRPAPPSARLIWSLRVVWTFDADFESILDAESGGSPLSVLLGGEPRCSGAASGYSGKDSKQGPASCARCPQAWRSIKAAEKQGKVSAHTLYIMWQRYRCRTCRTGSEGRMPLGERACRRPPPRPPNGTYTRATRTGPSQYDLPRLASAPLLPLLLPH